MAITSLCRNWRADRLTATGASGKPCARQAASCPTALRSTHSLIGTIMPLSSAIGMNSSGGMTPYSGWRQRTRASKPARPPLRRSTFG